MKTEHLGSEGKRAVLCAYLSCIYIYIRTYVRTYVCMYLSMYLSTYLPIYLSIYLSTYVSIYLCIYLSIYLCIYVFLYLSYVYIYIVIFIVCVYIYISYVYIYISYVYLNIYILYISIVYIYISYNISKYTYRARFLDGLDVIGVQQVQLKLLMFRKEFRPSWSSAWIPSASAWPLWPTCQLPDPWQILPGLGKLARSPRPTPEE